jgi:hypothetical protein
MMATSLRWLPELEMIFYPPGEKPSGILKGDQVQAIAFI